MAVCGVKRLMTPSQEYVCCLEFPHLKVTNGGIPGRVKLGREILGSGGGGLQEPSTGPE